MPLGDGEMLAERGDPGSGRSVGHRQAAERVRTVAGAGVEVGQCQF